MRQHILLALECLLGLVAAGWIWRHDRQFFAAGGDQGAEDAFQNFHRLARRGYAGVTLLLVLLGSVVVSQMWGLYRAATVEQLRTRVVRVQQQVDDVVAIGQKVLSSAQNEIEAAQRGGAIAIGDDKVHAILERNDFNFKLPESVLSESNLFAIDRQGRLYAGNAKYPMPPVDVRDRLYFRRLQGNPELRFVLGELALGRTEGREVMHLATALHNAQGQFDGTLVMQIPAHQLHQSLVRSILPLSSQEPAGLLILLETPEVHVAYAEPLPGDPALLDMPLAGSLRQAIEADERQWGQRRLADFNASMGDVAYAHSKVAGGFYVVAYINPAQLVMGFLQKIEAGLGFMVIASAMIWLMLRLYFRQSLRALLTP